MASNLMFVYVCQIVYIYKVCFIQNFSFSEMKRNFIDIIIIFLLLKFNIYRNLDLSVSRPFYNMTAIQSSSQVSRL